MGFPASSQRRRPSGAPMSRLSYATLLAPRNSLAAAHDAQEWRQKSSMRMA